MYFLILFTSTVTCGYFMDVTLVSCKIMHMLVKSHAVLSKTRYWCQLHCLNTYSGSHMVSDYGLCWVSKRVSRV